MVNRVVLSAGDFRVSAPGVDVFGTNSNDPEQLILSPDTQGLGVFMSGTVSFSGSNAPTQIVNFPYELPYVPFSLTMWYGQEDSSIYDETTESIYTPVMSRLRGGGCYVQTTRSAIELTRYITNDENTFVRYVVFFAKVGN